MAGTNGSLARGHGVCWGSAARSAGGFESGRVSMRRRMARALLWISAALIAWTQVGYAVLLALLRAPGAVPEPAAPGAAPPRVSLIVAAYREQEVIEAKVANALALDWPREALELIVAVDGGADPSADDTAARARAAGADVVLELPRGGK